MSVTMATSLEDLFRQQAANSNGAGGGPSVPIISAFKLNDSKKGVPELFSSESPFFGPDGTPKYLDLWGLKNKKPGIIEKIWAELASGGKGGGGSSVDSISSPLGGSGGGGGMSMG